MRILLVSPPSGDLTIGLKHLAKVEPLGLEIIGAAVPDHQVELLDMEIDTDLAGTLQRFQPDIVGASAQVVQTYTARCILTLISPEIRHRDKVSMARISGEIRGINIVL